MPPPPLAAKRAKPALRTYTEGLVWTGLDQVLSSLSNVLISLALARSTGARGLGLYTGAFAAYLLALGFQRSLIAEPLLALGRRPGVAATSRDQAATASLIFASGAGALAVLAGLITSTPIFVIIGPILLAVLGQDLIRYEFFRVGRPKAAVALDAMWTMVSLVGFGVILDTGSPELATALWGIGGAAGLGLGVIVAKVRLVPWPAALSWWRNHARLLGTYLTLENLIYTVADGLATVGIATTLGAVGLGELKGAEIVLAPGFLAMSALNLFLVPRLTQVQDASVKQVVVPSLFAALAGLVMMLLATLFAPDVAGLLYGQNLAVARALVVPLALKIVVLLGSVGAIAILKARGLGRPFVLARTVWAVIGLPVVLILLRTWGLRGAAWGFVIQNLLYSGILWLAWIRSRAHRNLTLP